MTDLTAAPEDRLSHRAAQYRRLAERVVAAAAERGGFVVVSEAPLSGRRLLLQAIAGAAVAFQVIEIAGTGELRSADPTAAVAGAAAAKPPLFVIDDAARQSSAALCELCATAPLSPEWAQMLSVRAVLITRFPLAELQFLAPRIIARLRFSDEIAETPDPPRSAAMKTADGGRSAASRSTAVAAAAMAPPRRAAVGMPRAAKRRGGRDWRLAALLAYLAAVGALGVSYLVLQNRQADHELPLPVAAHVSVTPAINGQEIAK